MAKMTFESHAEAFTRKIMEQISANMQDAQVEYARDMHDVLTNEPRGRYWKNAGTPYFYEVGGPGPGVHRSSAPGDPPTVFKGLLRDSIRSHVLRLDRSGYTGVVDTKAPYAVGLEFGTKKVAPRPAWLPTLHHNREKYGRIATQGFERR